MDYLVLFLLGVVFGRLLLAVLDALLEWFNNFVNQKVHLIQCNMKITENEVGNVCSKGEGNGHAIGFNIGNCDEEDFEDDD